MSDAAVVVSIRLSRPVHERLVAAALAARKTVGEFGRELVSEALNERAMGRVQATLPFPKADTTAGSDTPEPNKASTAALHKEIAALRKDIAVAVETLLVMTNTLTADQSKQFVSERFP